MALARIISRSHEYAKQLAFDLLARGYTVEIVSPDQIPETVADLELRVQAGPSEELNASVEAHDGARSASLEFLHRLKPVLSNRLRTAPVASQESSNEQTVQPVSFNAEPPVEAMELSAGDSTGETSAAPEPEQGVENAPVVEESARLISPTHRHANFSIAGEFIDWSEDEPKQDPSEVWFWRAAMGFAATALLILVLGLAMRRPETSSAASSGTNLGGAAPVSTRTASAAVLPVSVKQSAPTPVTKSKPSAVVRRHHRSGDEDSLASDTVVYFNKAAAKPAVKAAPEKQMSSAPSLPKPDGTIKHYSDLN